MNPFVKLDDIVIVIVEDDDDIRCSLAKFLIQKGATVLACPDASEALQVVRDHHPNIVLSDIGLPNRDGFQLLQDIRSLETDQGCDVPVIAMTGLNGVLERTRTVDGGFQATLQKPFKPDQLLAAVASSLNAHQ
jgi:DNA-binding response OmpR family regulator